jgi:hypothetical protein
VLSKIIEWLYGLLPEAHGYECNCGARYHTREGLAMCQQIHGPATSPAPAAPRSPPSE